jgi:hypothetical protein
MAPDAKAALKSIHDWMARSLTYRQMYLTPDRGWMPDLVDDVARRQYGDCKDLTTFLISEARAAGLKAYPALARIVHGHVEEDEPPSPFGFNHVIAAVRLEATLGLPAEVETPEGRFLLLDPTDRFVPFGYLGHAHAGRRLLICLEKGGLWVAVSEAAAFRARSRFSLAGELSPPGTLKGILEVREEGLRALDMGGGGEALRKFCLGLGLPPNARCDVRSRSDPRDLDAPYEVAFDLEYSLPLRQAGAREWTIRPPGLPHPGPPLQRPGQPRRLPVIVETRSSLEYDLRLRLPWGLTPVAPREEGETAFRKYAWTTHVRDSPPGWELAFHFSEERKPRSFGFDQREEGVAAWKEDRNALRRVHEEALAFATP